MLLTTFIGLYQNISIIEQSSAQNLRKARIKLSLQAQFDPLVHMPGNSAFKHMTTFYPSTLLPVQNE